jgi:4-hydroxy-tetrahydrodipicolinate synthase
LLDLLAREPDPVLIKLALSMLHPEVGAACRAPLAPPRPEVVPLLCDAIEDLPHPLAGLKAAGNGVATARPF